MVGDSNGKIAVSPSRRRALRMIGGGAGMISLAGCLGGEGDDGNGGGNGNGGSEELTEMHTIDSEDTHATTTWLWGINQGMWSQHGIELSAEFASFGKFVRSVNDDLTEISGVSLPPQFNFINEGADLVILGGQLPWIQVMFGKNETVESMENPYDLDDKVLGLPPESTTGANGLRALFLDQFDYDLFEDPMETRFSEPPTLWNLLLDDEIDATLLFTGGTIRALAHEDVAQIFNPSEYWVEEINDNPPTLAGWTAKRDWVEENADLALRFLQGWEDAVAAQAEGPDPSIRDFGRLIGLDDEAQQDVLREWMEEDKAYQSRDYTDDMIDNDYQFTEMLQSVGAFDELPAKEDVFISRDELSDMAEE